jgi:hypothetical protein
MRLRLPFRSRSRPPTGATTKLVVSLPEDTIAELQSIAACNNLTLTAAIRQSLANERFIGEQLNDGGRLIIMRGGQLHEVVFGH